MHVFSYYLKNGTASFMDAEFPESFCLHLLKRIKCYPAYVMIDY